MGDSSTVLFIVLIIVVNLCCSNNWKGDGVHEYRYESGIVRPVRR